MSSSVDHPRKKRVMCRSVWLRRLRTKTGRHHGSRVLLSRDRGPYCQIGDISVVAKITTPVLELDKLPEDVLPQIHSRVPLRDAARVACVSHSFLRSWRRFPNLTFHWKPLGLAMNMDASEMAKKLVDIIHHIIANHSGYGVKALKLEVRPCHNAITANHLNIWLQAAVKSGIEKLVLDPPRGLEFNFPCPLLCRAANSLQSLSLSSCAFHPTLAIGCLRNLRSLCLTLVHITEEELGCFFSSAISLEQLQLSECPEITFLKIPSDLQQIRILEVFRCIRLQVIEIDATKITTFSFGGPPIKILINDSSQLKVVHMNGSYYSGMFQYTLTELHSIASNLRTLILFSSREAFNMQISTKKFLHLKRFFLSAGQRYNLVQDSILEDSNANSFDIRRVPEFHHDNLKDVTITRFCSAKSLIELTCQILESYSSLQRLVLDTAGAYDGIGICENMNKKGVMEALRGVRAIKKYVYGKVPARVNFEVLEPCERCHISKL
ncbi:hypothetical protein ACP4OV_025996 [Aristida adscensionis]